MLEYELIVPPGVAEGAPLLVLMHGRGADRFDLLGLGPELAPRAVVVCPQAPWPGLPWGYGPGWAWYRYLGENLPEPESFSRSQAELEALLDALPSALPVRTGALLLGGFSQGGVMALGCALRNPGRAAAVLNFSGFFPAHPSVDPNPETVAGTRFFWGHGTADPAIPFRFAEQGRALLIDAGAHLTARDYPIGHGISPQELADARGWLEAT